MRLGPEQRGERSVVGEVTARRYRCLCCSAVVVVVPRGVLPRLRYGAVAIALALGLWSTEGLPAATVRARVSPFVVVGHEAQRGWRSLGRWARGSPWPVDLPDDAAPRQRAGLLVQWLAGHALGPGSLSAQACAGALRA